MRIETDEAQVEVFRLPESVKIRVNQTDGDFESDAEILLSPQQTAELCRSLVEAAWEIVSEYTEPLVVLVKAMGVDK